MRARANLGKTAVPVHHDVPLHSRIRIKPQLSDATRGGLLLGELQQSSGVAPPLLRRPHRNAVDEQVIRPFLQDNQTDRVLFDFEQPDFAARNAGAIVVRGRLWDDRRSLPYRRQCMPPR